MPTNHKISQYKIKKILKCFTQDSTATDTSKLMKLNIKTINKYYNIFREIILQFIVGLVKIKPEAGEYIGYIKASYGYKCYFNIFKMDKKTFIPVKLIDKPDNSNYAMHDKDFNKYLCFLYKRFPKFYGFSSQNYRYQLFESIIKYNYTEEALFNLIWKPLIKKTKKLPMPVFT